MQITRATVLVEVNDDNNLRQVYLYREQVSSLISLIGNGYFGSPVKVSDKVIETLKLDEKPEEDENRVSAGLDKENDSGAKLDGKGGI